MSTTTEHNPEKAPTAEGLLKKLHLIRKAKVAVVGDLVADEYVYGETDRVSREAPVPVVSHEFSEVKLGGAANAAANVAALGARVFPVGILGNDEVGTELLRLFEAAGAETSGVLQVEGRFTETKTRILAGGRSSSRQQLLRLDRLDSTPLKSELRQQLLQKLEELASGSGALLVSDYGSGLIDSQARELLSRLALKIPVCVDSRYNLESFYGINLAKPNEPELEALSGIPIRSEADVELAAKSLMAKSRVQAVLVTRGRLGMHLVQESGPSFRIPAFGPGHAVDVTGAGDTVLATFVSARAAGMSLFEATYLANVAGGLVVQKPGTATCSYDELKAALEMEAARNP